MVRVWSFRLAGAVGLFVLAVFMMGLDSLLNWDPTAGAVLANRPASFTVNRAFKTDRLIAPDWDSEFNAFGPKPRPKPLQSRAQAPFGCDPAFSPIFVGGSNVYRRCMA